MSSMTINLPTPLVLSTFYSLGGCSSSRAPIRHWRCGNQNNASHEQSQANVFKWPIWFSLGQRPFLGTCLTWICLDLGECSACDLFGLTKCVSLKVFFLSDKECNKSEYNTTNGVNLKGQILNRKLVSLEVESRFGFDFVFCTCLPCQQPLSANVYCYVYSSVWKKVSLYRKCFFVDQC